MRKNERNEQGIVAIAVTLILMIVLSIIVLSFARVSRREAKDAADRQLSTQAFYAAESGVNYAVDRIRGGTLPAAAFSNTNCTSFFAETTTPSSTAPIDVGANSQITCLFVDDSVAELKYTVSDKQIIFPYIPTAASPSLNLYWDDASGGTNFSCPTPANHPSFSTCNAAVLRIEVTTPSYTSSRVFFVYPGTGGTATVSAGGTSGSTYTTGCAPARTPQKCLVTLSGLANNSYIRIIGIYNNTAMTVVPSSGELRGAQAMVDSTGKTADVLRRIQVRVPIGNLPTEPPRFTLEASSDICKQFIVGGINPSEDKASCWTNPTAPN